MSTKDKITDIPRGRRPLAGQSPNASGLVGAATPPAPAIRMAVMVVTVAPIVLVYPFVRRHLVKGVIVGAVRG